MATRPATGYTHLFPVGEIGGEHPGGSAARTSLLPFRVGLFPFRHHGYSSAIVGAIPSCRAPSYLLSAGGVFRLGRE